MRSRTLLGALSAVAAVVTAVTCAAPASALPPTSETASTTTQAASAAHRPHRYVLPGKNVFPEGIAADQRTGTFWVSSFMTGAVYRGHVSTRRTRVFLPAGRDGRKMTIGLEYSRGVLYVAGGETGEVWAYGAYSGRLLARRSTGVKGFVNDVAVGRDGAAYFTDSFQPYIYRLSRTRGGTWKLSRWLDVSSTVRQVPGAFNLNGIDSSADGRYLYTVNMTTGALYRINIRTKAVRQVRVSGAELTAGDGLERRGNDLYVVRNEFNQIVRLRLVRGGRAAVAVAQLTDPALRIPTTAEVMRGRLLVVNSQFDRPGTDVPPDLPFTVTAVRLF